MSNVAQNYSRGVQPHFQQRLIEVDAEETPAFSLIRKGTPLKNQIAQQPIDTKEVAGKEGKLDGTAAGGANNQDNYRILESWNHWFQEPVSVGKKAQKLVDQAGVGLNAQYARKLMKKSNALKVATDQVLCDDGDMRAEGTDGKGSETRGLFSWCSATAQSVKPVDALYRTPANQITDTVHASYFEETLQSKVNAFHDNTGKTGKFIALAGIFYKQKVSNWSILSNANATQSYLRRFTDDASKEAKVLTALVNVLECDGGMVELHKTRNLLWSRTQNADGTYTRGAFSGYSMIGWNEGCAELRFGWGPETYRLPENGGSMEGVVEWDLALCADPTGLIKHVPSALS